ncbi:hypothetical protein [Photobacterium sp. R1]
MKHFKKSIVAILAMTASLPVLASESIPGNEAPAWAIATIGFFVGLAGVVSQADAQMSEEFKRKWPWWLKLTWNLLVGNYKHSRNVNDV